MGPRFTIALFAISACAPPASEPVPPPFNRVPRTPQSVAQRSTSDPILALANLDGQIARLKDEAVSSSPSLVDLLILRGRVLGKPSDYEAAEAVAEAAVKSAPLDSKVYLSRARARAAFHRFKEARADLDEAVRLAARADETDPVRASILQATGAYDEALALRRAQAKAYPGFNTIGALAAALAERGDYAEASTKFLEAQEVYRDVSPFSLCWLYLQEGLMWMRAGDFDRARELLSAANERLPQDVASASQLGWLEAVAGHGEKAIALLRSVASAEDPEPGGLLARVLQLSGNAEASAWRTQAGARFDDLVKRHPEAYSDHAAQFWLSMGRDPSRAFELARANLKVRRTPSAWTLMMQAATATGRTDIACDAARHALTFGGKGAADLPLSERAAAQRTLAACAAPAKGSLASSKSEGKQIPRPPLG